MLPLSGLAGSFPDPVGDSQRGGKGGGGAGGGRAKAALGQQSPGKQELLLFQLLEGILDSAELESECRACPAA